MEMRKRRSEIESGVFEHAPTDWPEYQHRFGQWKEVNFLIAELEKAAKGIEDDLP